MCMGGGRIEEIRKYIFNTLSLRYIRNNKMRLFKTGKHNLGVIYIDNI